MRHPSGYLTLSRETLLEAAVSEAKRFEHAGAAPAHLALVLARHTPAAFDAAFGGGAADRLQRGLKQARAVRGADLSLILETWGTGAPEDLLAGLASYVEELVGSAEPVRKADDAEWSPGNVVAGVYEVLELAGQGGMGRVYRVRHRLWGIDLAVKTPSVGVFATSEQRAAFEREAHTWMGVGLHPHVCACHYMRTLGGVPRLFAEYVGGGSLALLVRRRVHGDLESALDCAIQLARGLAHAHARGVVHQDVKPENVLFAQDGTVKVTDFGLARAAVVAHSAVPDAEHAVSVAGFTKEYASPEQAAGLRLSAATDVWSFAITVVDVLTGTPAQDPLPTTSAVLKRLVDAPRVLEDLLVRCLADQPEERPQMAQVARELEAVYEQLLGSPYTRRKPEAAPLLAGELSNRALSMLDLARPEDAARRWAEALAHDPHHPQATYNLGTYRWRRGEIADDEVVRSLEAVRDSHERDWLDEYLLSLVHLERRDPRAAEALLDEAEMLVGDEPEIAAARRTAAKTVEVACLLGTLASPHQRIDSIALTADGRFAVTGSRGRTGTAELWDLSTLTLLRTLEVPTHAAPAEGQTPVALTPDGRVALVGRADGTLSLWELAGEPRCVRTLDMQTTDSMAIALTPDGRSAVAATMNDRSARVWDLTSRRRRAPRELKGMAFVAAVALAADGLLVLSAHIDGVLRLWSIESGELLGSAQCSPFSVLSVAFIPGGRRALAGSIDGTVSVWDLESGTRALAGHTHSATGVALTENGRFGLSGGYDGATRLWDCDRGRCLNTLAGGSYVTAVALTPDGRLALSGDQDGNIRVWEIRAGEPSPSPWAYTRPRPTRELADVATTVRAVLGEVDNLVAAGNAAAAAERLRALRQQPDYARHPELLKRWRAIGRVGRKAGLTTVWQRRALREETREGEGIYGVAVSDDATRALTVGGLWNLDDGSCVLPLGRMSILAVALTPDGRRGLTAHHDATACLWDFERSASRTLAGHNGPIVSAALTPDAHLAVTGSLDATARVWDGDAATCLASLAHPAGVTSVAISADGSLALTGDEGGAVRLWHVEDARCVQTVLHGDAVAAVALMHDGQSAVSGGYDRTARLWDIASGTCLSTLDGHAQAVTSVAFTRDRRLALTGSRDGTAKLWELNGVRCLYTLDHGSAVLDVATTPDAAFALTGGTDLATRLWEFDWEYEFPPDASAT